MMQQVNLFRPQFVHTPTALGWRSLLLLAGVALLSMAAISVFDLLQQREVARQVSTAGGQLKDLRDGLARLNQEVNTAQADPHRAAARERLRRKNLEARQFFQALSGLSQPGEGRFSAYFRGLARHPVSGLWLEEMRIQADGHALVLRGQALEPSLIPRFLQALRDEPAFVGHAFAEVEFERSESAAPDESVHFRFRSIADPDSGGRDG